MVVVVVADLYQRISVVEGGEHSALCVAVPVEFLAARDVVWHRVDERLVWTHAVRVVADVERDVVGRAIHHRHQSLNVNRPA